MLVPCAPLRCTSVRGSRRRLASCVAQHVVCNFLLLFSVSEAFALSIYFTDTVVYLMIVL